MLGRHGLILFAGRYFSVELYLHISEEPCTEATVFLSALPQREEDLVQFQSFWGQVPTQPEVRQACSYTQ